MVHWRCVRRSMPLTCLWLCLQFLQSKEQNLQGAGTGGNVSAGFFPLACWLCPHQPPRPKATLACVSCRPQLLAQGQGQVPVELEERYAALSFSSTSPSLVVSHVIAHVAKSLCQPNLAIHACRPAPARQEGGALRASLRTCAVPPACCSMCHKPSGCLFSIVMLAKPPAVVHTDAVRRAMKAQYAMCRAICAMAVQMARSEAPQLEQMAQKDMTGAGGAGMGAGTSAAATPAGATPDIFLTCLAPCQLEQYMPP